MAKYGGYKPQAACGVLDIGFQALRYWRENLQPSPKDSFFSGSDLLAFRIIKILIKKRHLSVELLSNFSMEMIFYNCRESSPDEIRVQTLLLDESNFSIRFVPSDQNVEVENLDLHIVPLGSIVKSHFQALHKFGS